jgi:predicted ABC-type ATPase
LSKKIIIIAGPNGAGKTTFARSFLPVDAKVLKFINADLIAAGLSPFAPELASLKAGRLMLQEIDNCAKREESFAFETTLAGMGYLRHIRQWRAQGYRVHLHFLMMQTVEQAIDRVAMRVSQGGHNIPEDVIKRRYAAGLENFEHSYKPCVDYWTLHDSSKDKPVFVSCGGSDNE